MTKPTSGDADVAALRQDIAQTRAELGETVEALAAKADVKTRAQEKVDETKARVGEAVAEAKDKAREKAQQVADSGRELARELRTEPAVPARRAVYRVRTSVRDNPRQWVVAAAALLAFAALIVRRRQRASQEWRGPR